MYNNGTEALHNINLTVEKGEFVFIVGSSGAGKSTFLKLVMCEERPNSGQIIVDGVDVSRLPKRKIPYIRRKMGIVFQDFRLIDHMTVYDNVASASGYPTSSAWWACSTRPSITPPSFPAASASVWAWPVLW